MFIGRNESTALLSDISHTLYSERLDVHRSYLTFPLPIFNELPHTYPSYDVPNSMGLRKSKKLFSLQGLTSHVEHEHPHMMEGTILLN